MKPEPRLIAERPFAMHCPELLRSRAAPVPDTGPELARMGLRLARALASALGPLLGGAPPAVACAAPQGMTGTALLADAAPLAAHCLLGIGAAHFPLLVSMDAGAVLRIVDRAFGGRGEAPVPLPDAFPLSADLMIARLETLIAARLAEAAGLEGDAAVQPLRRDASLAQLAPFAGDPALTRLVLTVTQPGQQDWHIALTCPPETLALLAGAGASPLPDALPRPPAHPLDAPYADVPLPLTAVIVDMQVPFALLARLAPGQVLPVAVARNVPLRVGERTIAHGSVGAVDDRVAVQINQIF